MSRTAAFDDGLADWEESPRTKPQLNGHLVNTHNYTEGGAGNSARNLPRKDELESQHAWLHKHTVTGHTHGQ